MLTKEEFSSIVEKYFLDNKCDILDAIICVASKMSIEIEYIPKFLTPSLKSLIENHSKRLKLIKNDDTNIFDLE